MTEITRVPLQPIAKGSVTKIWLGIAAIVLAAGGVAYAALPVSVHIETLTKGTGESPTPADVALVNYKGTLPDGKVFDQQQQAVFPVAEVVPGFSQALQKMQRGGKYKVEIPAQLAYGDKQAGAIPPNTDLAFEVELLDFKNRAEIEQQQRILQQLQQQQLQGGAGGAGAGAPVGSAAGAVAPVPN